MNQVIKGVHEVMTKQGRGASLEKTPNLSENSASVTKTEEQSDDESEESESNHDDEESVLEMKKKKEQEDE